ncbi:sensor histidine kinase [soil metagenome]
MRDDEDVLELHPAKRRPSAVDWWVLAAMLVLGYLGIFLAHDLGEDAGLSPVLPQWADYAAFTLFTVPVVLRRVAPLLVCLGIGTSFAAFRLLEVPELTVSAVVLFLAIHAAGAYGRSPRTRTAVRSVALLAGALALVLAVAPAIEAVTVDVIIGLGFTLGINMAFYAAAWVLGDAARAQRVTQAQLVERAAELAAELAAEREKVAQQAVTEERVRIARELHDVVAHHVSVMGVQAAAARHVLDRDPARAAAAMTAVEGSAREAIEELQRLVAILRSDSEDGDAKPQPTLDDVDQLLVRSRETGLQVTLRRIGRSRPVPQAVALSVYRIIQEALTNARRHAPGAPVTVVLTHLEDDLQVEVVNGRATQSVTDPSPRGGRGLLGMRERVGLLGGTLTAGVLPDGGFRIAANFPSPAPAAALAGDGS